MKLLLYSLLVFNCANLFCMEDENSSFYTPINFERIIPYTDRELLASYFVADEVPPLLKKLDLSQLAKIGIHGTDIIQNIGCYDKNAFRKIVAKSELLSKALIQVNNDDNNNGKTRGMFAQAQGAFMAYNIRSWDKTEFSVGDYRGIIRFNEVKATILLELEKAMKDKQALE